MCFCLKVSVFLKINVVVKAYLTFFVSFLTFKSSSAEELDTFFLDCKFVVLSSVAGL